MGSDRAPRLRVQVSLFGKITKIQISAALSLISATEKNAKIQGSVFQIIMSIYALL
jgi:hypothetical protein